LPPQLLRPPPPPAPPAAALPGAAAARQLPQSPPLLGRRGLVGRRRQSELRPRREHPRAPRAGIRFEGRRARPVCERTAARLEVDGVGSELEDPAPLSVRLSTGDGEQTGGGAHDDDLAIVLAHGPFLPARHGTAAPSRTHVWERQKCVKTVAHAGAGALDSPHTGDTPEASALSRPP